MRYPATQPPCTPVSRSRPHNAGSALLTLLLGLASRRFGPWLPSWLTVYAGDTLWALLVFWLIGWLWPRGSRARVAGLALVFAFGIELSQLYHAPWLDAIRRTTPGALLLGRGFLWTDLGCYAVGVLLGYGLEGWWARKATPVWSSEEKEPPRRR